MDNRPIGVFDSGVGGLSVVRELHKTLPHENIVYFGDTGRLPYGTKSRQTVRKYAAEDIRFLITQDVKAIVAACGTVSTNLSDDEVAGLGVSIPYTGVLLPSVRTACELSAGRIGVIATPASIRSGAYERAVRAMRPEARFTGAACPLLVPLVENGMLGRDNEITRLTVQMYLEPIIQAEVDTLILGCTHYPLLYDIINDVLQYKVTLVDSGAAAAQRIKTLLAQGHGLCGREDHGSTTYHVTDTVEGFCEVARYFLREDVAPATRFVDLDGVID